jgi:hypothetical protein
MFRPLENKGRVETILSEFDVIFDLIDVLLKRAEKPLASAFSLADVKSTAPGSAAPPPA